MDILSVKEKARHYKTRVSSRYSSIDFENITERIIKQDAYFVSTKYDGHFYTLSYQKGKDVVFVNPKGKTIEGLHINKEAKKILDTHKNIQQLIVAGEMFVKSEERTRSFDFTKALTDKDKNICFAVFDSIEINNTPTYTKDLIAIIEELEEIFPKEGSVFMVANQRIDSRKNIAELFKETVEINRQEGLVVKTEGNTYKVKPKYTLDAVVIGFADSDGDRKGMFRDLLIAMMLPDNSYQILGHLHHGFSDEQRKKLSLEMEKDIVASEYIEVARNKTAFHLIKPTRVIEFSCLDIITEDSKGPIGKMNLSYDDKQGFKVICKKNSVSLTIANFIRFRTDKEANAQDVRFDQIEEFISFEEVDIIDEKDLKSSEIIHREVYTKMSKEHIMVRKFVILKTNKEKTNKYPAYVLFTTDFSPGRKDPLKSDLKLTNSEKQVKELLAVALEKNIKKGWEKVKKINLKKTKT